MEERIQRIQKMESLLDELTEIISEADKSFGVLIESLPKLKSLVEYYESDWINDWRADERKEILQDLKRGVLSEDAVFNLLYDYRVLAIKMKSISPDL